MTERQTAALIDMANRVPALRDGLREALDEWEEWLDDSEVIQQEEGIRIRSDSDAKRARIAELRKLLA